MKQKGNGKNISTTGKICKYIYISEKGLISRIHKELL